MTSRSKKTVIVVVLLLLALGLWWGFIPRNKIDAVQPAPAAPVVVAPEPKPEPAVQVAKVEPAPVAVTEPVPVKASSEPAPLASPVPEQKVEVKPEPAPAVAPATALVPTVTPDPEPIPAAAVTTPAAAPLVLEEPAHRRNKVSLSYRLGLNITADFKRLGGFGNANDPGSDSGATENRNYDDGYNRVDVSTNAFGYTSYWGYSDPDQFQNGNIVLHHASSPSTGISEDNDNGVNHGIELGYQYEIQRGEKNNWSWGAEAALGYTRLDIDDTRVIHNEVNEITDTFSLPPGFILPPAPYQGTFDGPNQQLLYSDLLTGNRVRTTVTHATTITGHRELQANIFLIRVGPYFDYPLNEDFSLFANAGLNLVVGDMDFKYNETVAYDGNVRATRSDSGSETDFLVGAYVGGGVRYKIDDEWSLFAGAQFQTAGRSVTKEGGKEAVLDMRKAVAIMIGVSYSF